MTVAVPAAAWILDWTPSQEVKADTWRVYWRLGGTEDPWSLYGETTDLSMALEGLPAVGIVEVALAAVVDGIEAPEERWERVSVVPGSAQDLEVVPDVSGWAVDQAEHVLAFTWAKPTAPNLRDLEVREGALWASGQVLAHLPVDAGRGETPWRWGGAAASFMAKFRSHDGRYSGTAASASLTVRQDPDWIAQGSVDEHTAGFTGTKTDTEVSGGNLRNERLPGWASITDDYTTLNREWWRPSLNNGTYVTAAVDAGVVVDERIEALLTISIVGVGTTDWRDMHCPRVPLPTQDPDTQMPGDLITSGEEVIAGRTVLIEIDTTQDDPAGTPTWDGFRRWVPGRTYRYRGVRLRLTIDDVWPFAWITVSGFTWRRRRKNLKAEQEVGVSATGGTSVTWNSPFTVAPAIAQPRVVGQPKWYVTVSSETASGCSIQVYNDSDVEQDTATVHMVAAGV